MSLLPIVKMCRHSNTLRLFTRVGKSRHSTVFRLDGLISDTKGPDAIQIAPSEYITDDAFGKYMAQSTTPTCQIIGRDVVSMCDMQPGDQLTYSCTARNDIHIKHTDKYIHAPSVGQK